MNNAPAPFQSASLYVGDLNNEVDFLHVSVFNQILFSSVVRFMASANVQRHYLIRQHSFLTLFSL